MENNKTFILVILSMVLTWLGVWLGMFDPSVFETTILGGLGAYTARTVTAKVVAKKKE